VSKRPPNVDVVTGLCSRLIETSYVLVSLSGVNKGADKSDPGGACAIPLPSPSYGWLKQAAYGLKRSIHMYR